MTAIIALVGWVLNTAVGLVLLVRLLRARRQAPRLVYYHLVTALIGLGFWIGFVATGSAVLAWIGFAVLVVHNTSGDNLMLKGWKKRNPAARGIVYFQAVKYTLTRPLPLAHAMLAGVTFFPALAAAVISS
jgi:hypothetical protein